MPPGRRATTTDVVQRLAAWGLHPHDDLPGFPFCSFSADSRGLKDGRHAGVLLSTPLASSSGRFGYLCCGACSSNVHRRYAVDVESDVCSQNRLVMLIGLAKNAILIVSLRGKIPKNSHWVLRVSLMLASRLRPILMTSSFVFGCVPLWFVGCRLRRPPNHGYYGDWRHAGREAIDILHSPRLLLHCRRDPLRRGFEQRRSAALLPQRPPKVKVFASAWHSDCCSPVAWSGGYRLR